MAIRTTRPAAVAASALTIGVIGLFTGPVPAQAAPCSQWGFNGFTVLMQTNSYWVQFTSTGPTAQGTANSYKSKGAPPNSGPISGGIDGSNVNLSIEWGGQPRGVYTGTVDANGNARGTTYDAGAPGSTAEWSQPRPTQVL